MIIGPVTPRERISACSLLLIALGAPGCFLERAALPSDNPQLDAGRDAGRDSGTDAGRVDGGPRDAGRDAGSDAGTDAGTDAGPPVLAVTAGLLMHLDARDVNGDASPPGPLPTGWADLTGPLPASCTAVAFEPDGLGAGRPAMFTDGNVGSRCEFRIPDLNDVSVFVVLRTSDTRTADDWQQAPVIVGGDRLFTDEDSALYLSIGRPGFARGGAGLGVQSATSIADDAPHFVGVVRTASSGEVRLFVDSGAAETGTSGTGTITSPNVWWLASHETAADGRFAAHYGEVLVYERALSDAEVAQVRDYLQRRWGL